MIQSPLELALINWEAVRHLGESILIAGLLCEVANIVWLHHSDARTELRAGVVATAIVILGVGIEIFAGGRADDIIHAMRAPRYLSDAAQGRVLSDIQRYMAVNGLDAWDTSKTGQRLPYVSLIEPSSPSPEAQRLADQLDDILRKARWFGAGSGRSSPKEPIFGVVVHSFANSPRGMGVARAVASALNEVGVEATVSADPGGCSRDLMSAQQFDAMDCSRISIVVGEHP